MKTRGEAISLSTIYRTLKLMTRMGILRELELAEGHKHYELNTSSPHHHHHLVCIQCNQTIEFENDSILKTALKQVDKAGLQMIDCQLTIYGICPEALRLGWPVLVTGFVLVLVPTWSLIKIQKTRYWHSNTQIF